MNSAAKYYTEPYLQELSAEILEMEAKGANTLIELSETIFYPEGGGQPSDQGEIVGINGKQKVELVQNRDGRIIHQGKVFGQLAIGESVKLQIKWSSRFHNMRVHTAGHLVHDTLMTMTEGLIPIKGNHGSKAFLQYRGEFSPDIREALEQKVNQNLAQDLAVVMKESSYDEIQKECRFVPPGLPKNKALRILQIGEFSPMPDGGVHVKSTKEIGRIIIQEILTANGETTIKYRISGSDS